MFHLFHLFIYSLYRCLLQSATYSFLHDYDKSYYWIISFGAGDILLLLNYVMVRIQTHAFNNKNNNSNSDDSDNDNNKKKIISEKEEITSHGNDLILYLLMWQSLLALYVTNPTSGMAARGMVFLWILRAFIPFLMNK